MELKCTHNLVKLCIDKGLMISNLVRTTTDGADEIESESDTHAIPTYITKMYKFRIPNTHEWPLYQ